MSETFKAKYMFSECCIKMCKCLSVVQYVPNGTSIMTVEFYLQEFGRYRLVGAGICSSTRWPEFLH